MKQSENNKIISLSCYRHTSHTHTHTSFKRKTSLWLISTTRQRTGEMCWWDIFGHTFFILPVLQMVAERGGRNGERLRTIRASLSSDISHLIFHLVPLRFTFCLAFLLLLLLWCRIQLIHLGDALWTRADEQVVLPGRKTYYTSQIVAPLTTAELIKRCY